MLDPKTEAQPAKLGRRHAQNLVLGTAQWGAAYGIANRTDTPVLREYSVGAISEMRAALRISPRSGIWRLRAVSRSGLRDSLNRATPGVPHVRAPDR
jgi:hypothetical protein